MNDGAQLLELREWIEARMVEHESQLTALARSVHELANQVHILAGTLEVIADDPGDGGVTDLDTGITYADRDPGEPL